MLYERDYMQGLTPEENEKYKQIAGVEFGVERKLKLGKQANRAAYPQAVRMVESLFPNNYLDNVELKDIEKISSANAEFLALLNRTKVNEADIVRFIKENKYYHIIGSLLWGLSFRFGHHGAYLFPEFQLGNDYRVDYLLIGKSSGGYEFVLIELEHPCDKITVNGGNLGQAFRNGEMQVDDWRRWLENNYDTFSQNLIKKKNKTQNLPLEFFKFDSSRFHYVVVAGRRSDFCDLTYRIAREREKEKKHLLHYDNLYDFSEQIIDKETY